MGGKICFIGVPGVRGEDACDYIEGLGALHCKICTQGEGEGLARFKWASLFSPNELKEDKRAARGYACRNKRPIRLGQAWSLYTDLPGYYDL